MTSCPRPPPLYHPSTTNDTALLNPGRPTLQPAVSKAFGFTRGRKEKKSNFGKASNSTPTLQSLHTHSSVHLIARALAFPPPPVEILPKPTRGVVIDGSQTPSPIANPIRSDAPVRHAVSPARLCFSSQTRCWTPAFGWTFCVLSAGWRYIVTSTTCSAGGELRIYSPINQHCHVESVLVVHRRRAVC